MLGVIGEIQTEAVGKRKSAALDTEGRWKDYHLPGLDAVCLVLYASPQRPPRTLYLWRCTLSTDTVTTYTIPHTGKRLLMSKNPSFECFAAGYEIKWVKEN